MAVLPNNYTIVTAAGAEWSATVTIYNDDGTLADITNKTFEMVARNRLNTVGVVLFTVTSIATGVYGGITVNVANSAAQVILAPAATATIVEGGAPYTLWMNPSLPDAEALLTGILYANPIAAP